MSSLDHRDLEALAARGISPEFAGRALLRRVDNDEGRQILGRNGSGRYEGIAIPYVRPGDSRVIATRIRRDHPEVEGGKPRGKYLSAPGAQGHLYFVPGISSEWLLNPAIQIVVTEGEFKTLALQEAAMSVLQEPSENPPILPVGLAGVWCWRGTIGKAVAADGARVDEKGPIPDLDRIAWNRRRVVIAFDRDLQQNEKVGYARLGLTRELQRRGARVHWFAWPQDAPDAKGVDDLIAAIGPDAVLDLLAAAPPAGNANVAGTMTVADVRPLREYASRSIEWLVDGLIARGTVTMFTGAPGSGKTTLISSLAGKIDTAEDFAGFQTSRVPVLLIDRENPVAVNVERFERLGVLDSDNFRVWGAWCPDEPPGPDAPLLIDWIRACDPKPMLIFDSLVAFHRGDENSASEIRATMQQFRHLADLGATVVLIHHSGKGESSRDFRGSSDIAASIDVGWSVSSLSGDTARLGTVALRAWKSRFAVEPNLLLRYVDGQFLADSRPHAKAHADVLVEILQSNPRISAVEFETAAIARDVARNRARDFLATAIASGKVRIEKGPHNSRFHVWVGGQE